MLRRELLNEPMLAEDGGRNLTGVYPVDIREDDDNVYVEAELPGFNKDEIDLNLEGGVLNISAERKQEEPKGTSHLQERRFTKVQRSFTLPSSVDENNASAEFDNGVLKLSIPKKAESRRRKIEVK
jgi:HSP20 family protein